jgi:hypothetical protein
MKIQFDKLYEMTGMGFGKWFGSNEPGLVIGTVRCIRGILFMVSYQHNEGFYRSNKYETCWVPVDEKLSNPEKMDEFRQKLVKGFDRISL